MLIQLIGTTPWMQQVMEIADSLAGTKSLTHHDPPSSYSTDLPEFSLSRYFLLLSRRAETRQKAKSQSSSGKTVVLYGNPRELFTDEVATSISEHDFQQHMRQTNLDLVPDLLCFISTEPLEKLVGDYGWLINEAITPLYIPHDPALNPCGDVKNLVELITSKLPVAV